MTTTSSRFFDEMAKLMTNAAGAAQGLRREIDTLVQAQVERVLNNLDVVKREEFEAVRDMARRAREENERLAQRLADLESEITRSRTTSGPASESALSSASAADPLGDPPSA